MENIFGTIQSLAFGGAGILKKNGRVTFVPLTAPGDQIHAQITSQKKTHAFAKLLQIQNPGPDRVEPKCQHYGICGGCQLQHLRYKAQLAAKKSFVKDAFERLAKIKDLPDFEVVPADPIWGYRRHIRLKLWPAGDGFKIGFAGQDPNQFVPIQSCQIFEDDPKNPILEQLEALVAQIPADKISQAYVMILKDGQGSFILHFHAEPRWPNQMARLVEEATRTNQWKGAVLTSPGKSQTLGDSHAEFSLEGFTFCYSPLAFVQNHPTQSANIYRDILGRAKDIAPKTAVDLYCGIGVTSVLLNSIGATVTGVESSPEAIRLARSINDKICWKQEQVEKIIGKLLADNKPDLVVLNPPRAGADKRVIEALSIHKPARIIYVSCMPPTLARDVQQLCAAGYKLNFLRAYDMFPQTSHVEVMVELERI